MGEEVNINTVNKEINELTNTSDSTEIRFILSDLVFLEIQPVETEQLIKTISEKTSININILKKQLREEKQTIAKYKKTTATKPFGIFVDKKELGQKFHEVQPYFYDKSRMWWFWNKEDHCYKITDDIDLLNEISVYSPQNTIKSSEKNEIVEALKQVGRKKKPLETSENWIQFKDKYIDVKKTALNNPTEHLRDITPEYLFTNPINWEIGENSDTPILDNLLEEWVGKTQKNTLYELIAYCCYPGYPIQLLFCLWGNGRNGKSQFLKILDKFIGTENAVSTELDLLISNRFESFKLFKKLVCTIGETNFGILSSTSLIKKLTGGDKIGFEKKNKDPFDDYNYAKMIIASNSLPSTDDTSDGFFRRWLIIDFPNEFEDVGKEVWKAVPDEEYKALAKKVTEILPGLLERGTFTGQGTIPERKQKYISVSNPLSIFIEEHCKVDSEAYELSNKLYMEYIKFLQNHKRRRVKQREFKTALEDEGFYIEKTNKIDGFDKEGHQTYKSGYFVMGLCFDEKLGQLGQLGRTSHLDSHVTSGVVNTSQLSQKSQNVFFDSLKAYLDVYKMDNYENACKIFGESKIKKLLQNGDIFMSSPSNLKIK